MHVHIQMQIYLNTFKYQMNAKRSHKGTHIDRVIKPSIQAKTNSLDIQQSSGITVISYAINIKYSLV